MKPERRWRILRFIAPLAIAVATVSCSGAGDGSGDGGSGSTGELAPTYPGKKIIFATSTADSGDLRRWLYQCSGRSAGLEAADCVCQQVAQNWGGLSGTYKAFLSDSQHTAASRLNHSTVPYVNRLGEQLALNWTDLITAPCSALWNHDERGDALMNLTELVWTGSDSAGNLLISPDTHVARTCDDWTSESITKRGFVGSAAVDPRDNFPGCWAEWGRLATGEPDGWQECDLGGHLYCFEQ